MLVSFSLPTMLPMVVNGIRAAAAAGHGELIPDVERWVADAFPAEVADAGERVKAQTIRAHNDKGRSNYARLVAGARMDIWWKSRTPGRKKLGQVILQAAPRQIVISNLGRIDGLPDVSPATAVAAPWTLHEIELLALADGFESLEAFRDFFVPQPGDRFTGWLVKWS